VEGGIYGIYLAYKPNNTIKNCIIARFNYGIYLFFSPNTTITNSTLFWNTYGIYVDRMDIKSCRQWCNDTIEDNVISENYFGIYTYGTTSVPPFFRANRNIVCGNYRFDFFLNGTSVGYGDNNTCDNPDGWNDTGTIGCTYTCIQPPQPSECNITNASIKAFCGNDGLCNVSEKIQLNISVENMSKCVNVNKIEINASEELVGINESESGAGITGIICKVNMFNTTPTTSGNSYIANFTISSIPSECSGKKVFAKIAALYNSSGIIASKEGNFGNFTFVTVAIGKYNLTVDTCGDTNNDGSCDNYTVKGNITVNGSFWGSAPQSRMLDSGIYNISFSNYPDWYKPNDILISLTNNMTVLGVYTKSPLSYSLIIVNATNETGHYINANISIYNATHLLNWSLNMLKYNYTKPNYPVNFTIKFGNVPGYITPNPINITLTNYSIVILKAIYYKSPGVPPGVNITKAYWGNNESKNVTVNKGGNVAIHIFVENCNNLIDKKVNVTIKKYQGPIPQPSTPSPLPSFIKDVWNAIMGKIVGGEEKVLGGNEISLIINISSDCWSNGSVNTAPNFFEINNYYYFIARLVQNTSVYKKSTNYLRVVRPSLEECERYNDASSCTEAGCYWDACTTCDNASIKECSAYKEEYSCTNDPCGFGKWGWDPLSNITYTGCQWNGSNCVQGFVHIPPGGGEINCGESISIVGSCERDKEIIVNHTFTSQPPGNESDCCRAVSGSCSDGWYSETIACPQPPSLKMPGWSLINVICVLILIFVYYVYVLNKQKSKRGIG
jgi:parallel beta-helix repeat protein